MIYNLKIHGVPHLLKLFLGELEFALNKPKNKILVLNYHGTPKKFINNFENQLDFFQKYFQIIHPGLFFDYLNGKPLNEGNYLLLTFDDGIKNNLYAVDVLNKKGISAVFFVVPGFIDSSEQKSYYINNIRPQINNHIDSEQDDFVRLNWDELNELKKNHFVGSHSFHHSMSNFDYDIDNLQHEICYSADYISNKINKSVDSFCSINNTLLSVNEVSKKVINKKYKYHFTTIAGCNRLYKDPLFIKRINIECFWTLGACKFSVGDINLFRFRKKITLFQKLN